MSKELCWFDYQLDNRKVGPFGVGLLMILSSMGLVYAGSQIWRGERLIPAVLAFGLSAYVQMQFYYWIFRGKHSRK